MEDVLKEVSLMQRWRCEELELARYLESHEGVMILDLHLHSKLQIIVKLEKRFETIVCRL